MEEVALFYSEEVEDYLNQLALTLFRKDYFSYFENAVIYKDNIIEFIENNMGVFPSKKTPNALPHFGSNYIFYKSNQRTTWYIFFENIDNRYLITQIINSHCKEAKFL